MAEVDLIDHIVARRSFEHAGMRSEFDGERFLFFVLPRRSKARAGYPCGQTRDGSRSEKRSPRGRRAARVAL